MRGFLVGGRRLSRSVNFHEDEAGGVVSLLYHVKSRDPRFADTRRRVGERGRFERRNAFRFHLHMDVNDKHEKKSSDYESSLIRGCNRGPEWECTPLPLAEDLSKT